MLRSKLTNDASLLPGVDRRTREGRRYQDVVASIAREFPGAEPVALRELASLKFTLEREQGAVVFGEQPSLEGIVRLTHAIERKERALRLAKRARRREDAPGLAEYLAAKAEPSVEALARKREAMAHARGFRPARSEHDGGEAA